MKKGDLSLSITAIVVIVIAFVVLGLGLTLTRTIFREAEKKLPEAISVIDFETKPTSDNPITIPQTLEIGRGAEETMKLGFYNKQTTEASDARVEITKCIYRSTNLPVPDANRPTVASLPQDVKASDSVGYSIVITENELDPDTYICILAVTCDNSANPNCQEDPYEEKQFFLKVTA